MGKPVIYRRAQRGDSRFIAEMIEISSDGIASIEWAEQAGSDFGQTAIDIGSRNYANPEGDYSYSNCLIAQSDEPVGMVLSFAINAQNHSLDAKPPPYDDDQIYAPYEYLEALDSWYICGLAVLPDFRHQGIASELLDKAIRLGKRRGYSNTSLVAMLEKRKLIRFYEKRGFHITRSAPIVEHPSIRARGYAVLMETEPSR